MYYLFYFIKLILFLMMDKMKNYDFNQKSLIKFKLKDIFVLQFKVVI